MHSIKCNDKTCINNNDCSNIEKAMLASSHEKRIQLQQREHALMQKQRELHLQLQKLYLEQQQLDSNDAPEKSESIPFHSGLEYEIPSYCANCLGDVFEPSSKNSLSSEYSRKNIESNSGSALREEGAQMSPLSDHGRLEAIKLQILLKLGLKKKPNVTNYLPKQYIFDTLRRSGDPINNNDFSMLFESSEETKDQDFELNEVQELKSLRNGSNVEELKSEEKKETSPEEDQEFDDFYGKTREIITFAEKGKYMI
jgi:hypothetical protein